MKLTKWAERFPAEDDKIWKGAAGEQIRYVNQDLVRLVSYGTDAVEPTVIGTHRSKSIDLPVYNLLRGDDLRFVLRNNFHDWKLSVISRVPVEADFSGLFYTSPPVDPGYTGDPLHPAYFEGFPEDLIFGYYEENKARWSASIPDDQHLWAIMFLILRAVGALTPWKWGQRPAT